MGWFKRTTVMGFARDTVKRAALGLLTAQGVVIAGLVGVDAYQKRRRTRREGFPQPGTFHTRIADTDTTVYTYGEDLFDAMIAAIDAAEHQVLLETYIWKGDAVGARFRDAVNRAAERGVKVFVIFDGFANLVVNPLFYRFHPDVNAYRFPVLRPSIVFTNIRGTGFDHRKVLVVDDTVGFVGGYNIGSLYATKWRDTHLEVRGPSVWELRAGSTG